MNMMLRGLFSLESLGIAFGGLLLLLGFGFVAVVAGALEMRKPHIHYVHGGPGDVSAWKAWRSILLVVGTLMIAMAGVHFGATHRCVGVDDEGWCDSWEPRYNANAVDEAWALGAFMALAMATGWLWGNGSRIEATLLLAQQREEQRDVELEGIRVLARKIANPSPGDVEFLVQLRTIIARERARDDT